ncbi:MAG: sigma-70 family RNA polymerase sigma factor [Mucilaginibacter sp.]|nr:sigma-70 family RNA polymerase sigma factor [Mucilaginibacter sp.]
MVSLGALSDIELIGLMKAGEQRALAEIFERYWSRLLAVALNRLDNLEEAEECVQDVFLKLWNLRENLELKYTLATYLAAATRYRVMDLLDTQYRKQMNLVPLDNQDFYLNHYETADARLLEKELLDRIEAAVRQLPEKCRIVYRMSREDGTPNKAIAAELGISEKMVEAHLSRAIKGLRDNLTLVLPPILLLVANLPVKK